MNNVNVRAWPGGVGFTKCGGNYAATIKPQMEAAQKGFSQVLWLFGEDDELTEVGTMNMFTFWINEEGEKELVTAPLDGTILPGVTRDSILTLCKDWGDSRLLSASIRWPANEGSGWKVSLSALALEQLPSYPQSDINYHGKDHGAFESSDPDAVAGDSPAIWDTIIISVRQERL